MKVSEMPQVVCDGRGSAENLKKADISYCVFVSYSDRYKHLDRHKSVTLKMTYARSGGGAGI